jgi:anti-anti-sigma factor
MANNDVITIETTGPGSLRVIGEIDLETVEEFVRVVRDSALVTNGSVTIDLSGVRFFDSSGIKALLNLRDAGVEICLAEVPRVVQRVLEITGLDHTFDAAASAIPGPRAELVE